jgi:hypothetical protein
MDNAGAASASLLLDVPPLRRELHRSSASQLLCVELVVDAVTFEICEEASTENIDDVDEAAEDETEEEYGWLCGDVTPGSDIEYWLILM